MVVKDDIIIVGKERARIIYVSLCDFSWKNAHITKCPVYRCDKLQWFPEL